MGLGREAVHDTWYMDKHMNSHLAQSMCRASRLGDVTAPIGTRTWATLLARWDSTTRISMLEVPWPTHSP